MVYDDDNAGPVRFPLKARELSAADKALLAKPEAQAVAMEYPAWGVERIKAELQRRARRR